jgi:uncharacterized membrane protein
MNWYIFALLSAVFGALAMIFEKKTLFKEHATEFSTILKLFEILLMIFIIPFLTINLKLPLKTMLLILLLSFAVAITNILTSKSFRHMEMSKVVPLYNLTPLFVLVLAFILLKEELTPIHLIGVLILLIGTYVLEADHHIKDISAPFKKIIHSKYMIIFMVALVISAVETVGEKYVIASTDPATLLFLIYLFTAFILTVIHTFLYDDINGLITGFKKHGKGIFLVAVFATLSNLTWFYAISASFVSLVLPIKRTSTLFATIGGGSFFKEKHLLQKSIACIIMVAGAVIIIIF